MSTRQILGWTLIADSAAGLIWPTRYLRLLEVGPQALRSTLEAFAENPGATRVVCVAEMALGALLLNGSGAMANSPDDVQSANSVPR